MLGACEGLQHLLGCLVAMPGTQKKGGQWRPEGLRILGVAGLSDSTVSGVLYLGFGDFWGAGVF